VVPALWRLELVSGLQTAVRRGRIDFAYRDAPLADLLSFVTAIAMCWRPSMITKRAGTN
jgi:hypothetical protein